MKIQEISSKDLPGLYQSADACSLEAQGIYFTALRCYLILLVLAAFISYLCPQSAIGAMLSAVLFLATLGILIYLKVTRPDDTWYNGRAVAESVKTRAWRWMMQAEPYDASDSAEVVSKKLISDLKTILEQNRSLSALLTANEGIRDPITSEMKAVRGYSFQDRLKVYLDQRVKDQATWYASKSVYNKGKSRQWFLTSVCLHVSVIVMLLYRIKDPTISLPVEVMAVAAGAVLTWLQAKKHNELNSSYALAAHEIGLIRGEGLSVKGERELSEFVIDSESAFSREHTQWSARRTEQ